MKVRGKEAFVAPGPRPMLWGVPEKREELTQKEDGEQASRLEEVIDHPLKDADKETHVATWYFCLTIGKPRLAGGDAEGDGGRARRGRRNPFCVTYGQKNTVRPEFWFSVGKEQVKFFLFVSMVTSGLIELFCFLRSLNCTSIGCSGGPTFTGRLITR